MSKQALSELRLPTSKPSAAPGLVSVRPHASITSTSSGSVETRSPSTAAPNAITAACCSTSAARTGVALPTSNSLLEAGVPEADVPRVERMISTFIIGFGASEAEGRFDRGALDPRGRRGQLPEGDLPGHHRLAGVLDQLMDWDAEFEADLTDLERLITAVARQAAADRIGTAGSS